MGERIGVQPGRVDHVGRGEPAVRRLEAVAVPEPFDALDLVPGVEVDAAVLGVARQRVDVLLRVDRRRRRTVQRGLTRRVRFVLPNRAPVLQNRRFDAVLGGLFLDRRQPSPVRSIGRHDEDAELLQGDLVVPAVLLHPTGPFGGEPGFQRSRGIVEARV